MKPIAILFLFFLPAALFSDMGAIVPNGSAALSEPYQKAVILHNGVEEVLILGTDIIVEPAQPIVRFIPFPSKPAVSLSPAGTFDALNELIKKKDLRMVLQTKGANEYTPADVIVSRERLGAHEITVVKMNDAAHFRKWTANFLKENGFSTAGLSERTAAVASDYLDQGFRYFVFDVVRMENGVRSVDPVRYRFASKKLYYPLKTSKLFGGKGRIQLAVCAPTARDLYGMIRRPYEVSTTAVIRPPELKGVFPESVSFFRNKKTPVLQALRIVGDMNFTEDILYDPLKGLKELKAE